MRATAIVMLVGILLAAPGLVFGQTVDEKAAIRQAALDYIEGWFEGNAARMDLALHTELAKRTIFATSAGEQFISLTKAQMVEATQKGGGKSIPPDKRGIRVDILDVFKDIAMVRVESVSFIDYLHLAKSQGKWKIVNVVWQNNVKSRNEVAVDSKVLSNYVGDYELKPGFVIGVTLEDDRLMVQATNQPKVEIFAESETEFFLKVVEAQLSFVKDTDGKVTQLILHQGGSDAPAKKIK